MAHGGHVVARHAGFVVFVRHALPGESVIAEITDVRRDHAFAEAVEVLRAHPQREDPPCPAFRPFGCGGCDFQMASDELQRELKVHVLRQALARQGGLDAAAVEQWTATGVQSLGRQWHWRERMRFDVLTSKNAPGRLGMHAHRSDTLVLAEECTIAEVDVVEQARELARGATEGQEILVARGDDGVRGLARSADGKRSLRSDQQMPRVRHRVDIAGQSFDFRVPIDGFWQAHPGLTSEILNAVVEFADPQPGQVWWDLYAGAGPIAAGLAALVGAGGHVHAVESSVDALRSARRALHAHPTVRVHNSDVRRWLSEVVSSGSMTGSDAGASTGSNLGDFGELGELDGVVLDPPRSGAGRRTLELIAAAAPAHIVYIACDPVALGRDLATLQDNGYQLTGLRAWDAFPQSHHFETAAAFTRSDRIS